MTTTYLTDLLAATRTRIAESKKKVSTAVLEQRIASIDQPRPFADALGSDGVSIIAEIKRASPLKGPLNLDLNASEIADAYRRGGAAAISVLTEPDFFKGSLEDLVAATGAGLPVLLKDFVLDDFQILEARAAGADAVLLIVRILGDELADLVAACRALGMDALVEIHHDDELTRALDAGATLIGINHRDLTTFEVDPRRTAALAPSIPDDTVVVALSGVSSRAEVDELAAAGADAVLVGEALVTAADPAAALRALGANSA